MIKYYIDDFDIEVDNYKLDDEVINNINKLFNIVNNPKFRRVPKFKKKNEINFEILRNFKSTKLQIDNEGFKKNINNIKTLINKLSADTYINISENIQKELNSIINVLNNEHKNEISDFILKVCSSNKYYSKLYTDLYSVLYNNFEFINTHFNKNSNDLILKYKNIDYCLSSVDYNKHCEINKNNDIIKANFVFLSNLTNNNILKTNSIYNIINDIFDYMNTFLMNLDVINNHIIYELTDLLYNIINNINDKNINDKNINDIKNNINNIINTPSINNSIKFKFFDIQDKLYK